MGHSDRVPSADELERMKALVGEAMATGAFGLGTALIYPPGSFAGTDELLEMARVVGAAGGVYATHLRSEGDRLL